MAELQDDIIMEDIGEFQGDPEPKLKDSDRKRLDSIVVQMYNQKATPDEIKFVVEDFKKKYATKPLFDQPKKEPAPGREMESVFGGKQPKFGAAAAGRNEKIAIVPENKPGQIAALVSRPKAIANAAKAQKKLQSEIHANDDVVETMIRNQRMNVAGQNFNIPIAEMQATGMRQFQESTVGVNEQPVTPDEIALFKSDSESDEGAARNLLKEVTERKPEKKKDIQSAVYRIDAVRSVGDNDARFEKIEKNAKGIEKGELIYDVTSGQLLKPQGVVGSLLTGWQQKSQLFDDFSFFNNKTDDEVIAELERRRNEYDPDEPIPMPKHKLSELSQMVGSMPLKSVVAGTAVSAVASPAAGAAAAGLVGAVDFYRMGYAGTLQNVYYQLREEGKSEQEALHIARTQAKKEASIDAAMGGAMSVAGMRIGAKPLNFSPGYKTAATNFLKSAGKEGAIQGLIGAGGELSKNLLAQQAGIKRETGANVLEAIESNFLLTVGMGAAAKLGKGISSVKYKSLLNGLSKVDNGLLEGNIINEVNAGRLTEQQANNIRTEVKNYKELDSQIPENITEEARIDIQKKIERRSELESELESKNKAFHPEIKEKIAKLDEEIVELSKQKEPKTKEPEDIKKARLLIDDAIEEGTMNDVYAAVAKENPEGFMKFVADQSLGRTDEGVIHEAGGAEGQMREQFGDALVDKAIEMYPLEEKKSSISVIRPISPKEKLGIDSMTDADIEGRMMEIEENGGDYSEFNKLEKEMERRERDSVFNEPLEGVAGAVDALIKKEKEMPNGYGAFIEKRDARETKEVAIKYINAKNISDAELKSDFKEAVLGNPDTWYADGLKLRESLKEAANRGINTEEMIREIEDEYVRDGYTREDAKRTMARKLAPIFENSRKVETNETKLIKQHETVTIKPKEQVLVEHPVVDSGEATPPPPVEETGAKIHVERPGVELSHSGLQDVANEFSLPDVQSRERKSDVQLRTDAENTAREWAAKGEYATNIERLTQEAERGKPISDEETKIMEQHLANVIGESRAIADKTSPEYAAKFAEVSRLKKAGQKLRSAAGATLRVSGDRSLPTDSPEDMIVAKEEAIGRQTTPEEKQEANQQFEKIDKAKKSLAAKGKEIADRIRLLRPKTDSAQSQFFGLPIAVYDTALVAIAEAVEQGAKLAEAIQQGIQYVKQNGGFKDKKEEKNFIAYVKGQITYDERLGAYKERTKKATDKLKQKTAEQDFEPDAKPILELDEEARDIRKEYRKAKYEFELELQKDQLKNRPIYKKAIDILLEPLRTVRTILTSFDFSAPLRQGIIPTVTHPTLAAKAFPEMFKQAFSKVKFDEWLADLKDSPIYDVMEKSGLYISDPNSLHLSAKEENFMSNLAEKIPIIGALIKGSERAYVSYLNKMRTDLFNQGVEVFMLEGKTIENSPELYKGLADFVNTSTGRGKLGPLEGSADFLNTVFFSPRLMASRINMLGLSDAFTLGQKGFYSNLPRQVRIMALKDMMKFVGFGVSVLGLAKLSGAEVEDDPRSTDFGKIKTGNTRYDIWGGFQPYVRLIAQAATGQTKSTTTGNVKELTPKGRFDRVTSFVRGKLAPVPSSIVDIAAGENIIGEEATVQSEALESVTPMIISDVREAMKDQGIKAIFTVGAPSIFGVGSSTYGPNDNKKSSGSGSGKRPDRAKKPKRQTRK